MHTPIDADNLLLIRKQALAAMRSRFRLVEVRDIEDALQDAMERWCVRANETVRANGIDSTKWIVTVAGNALRDAMRRDRFNAHSSDVFEWLTDGRSAADDVETHDLLEFALQRLGSHSFPQLTTIVFHDQYGRTFENIAANLHCTVGAAMMHHTRAKAFLRKIIEGESRK